MTSERAEESGPVVTRTAHDTYACANDLRLLDGRHGCRTYECRTCFIVVMDDDDA